MGCIWNENTSYFSDSDKNDIFTSCSAKLFEVNNRFMTEHGINTPKLYYMDRTKSEFQFEYAYVEYINGCDMDAIIEKYPERVEAVMTSLRKNLEKMHAITGNKAGALNYLQENDFSTVEYALECAKKDIDYLVKTDLANKSLYLNADRILNKIQNSIMDSTKYSFIHYELGPNHVLVDENNVTYLIDIEGAKFFDVEMEHSFLKMRFGQNYHYLEKSDLDLRKMKFYLLWHYLSNICGAHQLAKKNYYDMDDVKGMISNLTGKLKDFCNSEGL